MNYQTAKTTRLGNRHVNEDRVALSRRGDTALLVVADGMGGHAGGKYASEAFAVNVISTFERVHLPLQDPERFLYMALDQAHRHIVDEVARQHQALQPRTTCVVCLVQDGTAYWLHVGDSRLYVFRRGEVVWRTRDHSVVEELQRLGKISAKQAQDHPQRNLVTQCVGSASQPPSPSYGGGVALEEDDVILLCSDGLWSALGDAELGVALAETPLGEALESLAYAAEAKSYPSSDNISAVALRWKHTAVPSVVAAVQVDTTDADDFTKALATIDAALNKIEKGRA